MNFYLKLLHEKYLKKKKNKCKLLRASNNRKTSGDEEFNSHKECTKYA